MKKIGLLGICAFWVLSSCATNQNDAIANIPSPIAKTPVENKPAPPPLPELNIPTQTPTPVLPTPNVKAATGELIFSPADFAALPDWNVSDLNAARRALVNSCKIFATKPATAFLSDKAQYAGKVIDWGGVCAAAQDANQSDNEFWQNNFAVWNVKTENGATGRLTSYFEPVISGSFTQDSVNSEALYAKPNDLLTIDLGLFDPSLKAKTIVGRIAGNNFVPYYKRADINSNIARPIFYTNIGDAISLQIQGSGRINMNDGKQYRAVFTATNGQPFSSPASELIRRGIMDLSNASAGNVKKWFETADPATAREIINSNPRTVFYELQPVKDPEVGPKGSQGAPLVAQGSMAIDPSYHAYGVPIFVSAYSGRIANSQSINRLVIAQDTGGAIKGPIRGDLFYGTGVEAGLAAGRVNHDATFWVLLPKNIDPTITNPKPKVAASH